MAAVKASIRMDVPPEFTRTTGMSEGAEAGIPATESPLRPVPGDQSDASGSQAAAAGTPRSRIRGESLARRFGRKYVASDVSIHVDAGEIVGLLGPNGAGKTTTFYMIVGLIAPTSGHVYLDQRRVTRLPMHRRSRLGIGYLPQEHSVFLKLTVEENIRAVAETLRVSRSKRRELVDRYLHELGLEDVARQKAYTLSGGEKRRLEISRALVTNPKFILLDEPFANIDPISVSEVQQIVVKLKAEGIGILITDHSVRETLRIVDRAYLMHQGRVLREGTSNFLVHDEESRAIYLGKDFDYEP